MYSTGGVTLRVNNSQNPKPTTNHALKRAGHSRSQPIFPLTISQAQWGMHSGASLAFFSFNMFAKTCKRYHEKYITHITYIIRQAILLAFAPPAPAPNLGPPWKLQRPLVVRDVRALPGRLTHEPRFQHISARTLSSIREYNLRLCS